MLGHTMLVLIETLCDEERLYRRRARLWSAGILARMSAEREQPDRTSHGLRAGMPALRQRTPCP